MIIENASTPFGIIRTVLKPRHCLSSHALSKLSGLLRLSQWNHQKNARLEKVKAVSIEPLGQDKEWNMDGEKENNFEQIYVRFNQDEVATYVG